MHGAASNVEKVLFVHGRSSYLKPGSPVNDRSQPFLATKKGEKGVEYGLTAVGELDNFELS